MQPYIKIIAKRLDDDDAMVTADTQTHSQKTVLLSLNVCIVLLTIS